MANLRTNNLSGEQGQNAYRGSVFFHGGGQLDVTSNSDFAVGTGAYTAELWFHSGLNSGENSIFGTFTASNFGFGMWHNANNLYFEERQNAFSGDNPRITYDKFEEGYWYHLAMCRDSSSGTLRAYVNGVQIGSTTSNLRTIAGTAPTIGENGAASNQCKGYISNIRFSNTELYPSGTTFTPPTSELTADASTILLACQNSDDPTQEETGKTLTNSSLLSGQPKVIPPYGVDAGNAFGGPIQQSSQGYMYFPTGRTEERGRGRAVIFAGSVTPVSPNFSSNIDYIEMRSSGVGVRFGNCTGNSHHGSCGSSTRGFMFGGQIGSPDVQTNLIEFVTIATEGNSTDFGDLLRAKRRLNGQGHSNKTRAILAGGGGDAPLAPDNVIQFFTMASTGDATDFGDLNAAKDNSAGTGSPTRMLIAGGRDYTPSATVVNKIEYITMSTTGNVTDFGDLTVARAELARASNAVRSVFVSGGTPSPKVNTIDFVTTATTGDATDFGDLPIAKGGMASANNSIIGIFVAGTTGSRTTDIQSLTIATTGNGVAFGDCNVTDPSQGREGCSDSHGGLS
jgi:hypothetical protein